MAANWNKRFDEPIKLPGGGKLFTLRHAIAWLAKEVPQAEHKMKEIQTAAHCVTEAAENGGPMIFARMGMMHTRWRRREGASTRLSGSTNQSLCSQVN